MFAPAKQEVIISLSDIHPGRFLCLIPSLSMPPNIQNNDKITNVSYSELAQRRLNKITTS